MKVTKNNSDRYNWGDQCLGWHLVNNTHLSVIQEIMPPGAEEIRHKHLKTQQFFYVLKGRATFIINEEKIMLGKHEGIHIAPNTVHQVKNAADEELEFLVISQPHSHQDRVPVGQTEGQ